MSALPVSSRALLLVLLVAALAASVQAQAPAAAPPAAAPAAADTPVTPIMDAELEPPPGGWTYNPQGRRDPFVSLLKPVGPAGDQKGPRPQGIAGFLIQEVALKGVVKTPEGFISMLLGPDGKSYFCKLGQRLYDGAIIAMDQATVTFRQEVTDPLSPVKTREVKKTLYPSEEARP
jgi:hypothetical protein